MEAVYKLRKSPASFNFAEFLVSAKTLGATSILLDDSIGHKKKYSPEVTQKRMQTIVEPLCELIGLPFRYGKATGNEIDCGYHISTPLRVFRETGRLEKFPKVSPGTEKYTVTLRDYDRFPQRNSNVDAWRKFAKDIGAYVIEEGHLSLKERMALYSGAKMNFFTNGGWAAMGMYSEVPYRVLLKGVDRKFLDGCGLKEFGQLPWANADQKLVWSDDDSYENLCDLFSNFRPDECCGQVPELIFSKAGLYPRCGKCGKQTGTVGSDSVRLWNLQNRFVAQRMQAYAAG